jgi:monofunctional glycosyltransferase
MSDRTPATPAPPELRAPTLLTRDYTAAPPPRRRRFGTWLLLALLALVLAPPATVLALRWLPPPTSAFMLQSPVRPVRYDWVPAPQIPEALRRAAIAAEDPKFWTHAGFDFEAIEKAMAHNQRSTRVRGASTISQQVAKNLFLWPSRSYLRKGLEVSFTVLLELLWPKARILEVYLNIAEFGPGIYGAEAAAQAFFRKPARALTAAESAQLVAVLPNPRKWRAASPGPYVQSRVDWILGQLGEPPRFASIPQAEEPLPAGGLPAEPELVAPGAGVNGIGTRPLADVEPEAPVAPDEEPLEEEPVDEEPLDEEALMPPDDSDGAPGSSP